MTHSVMRNGKNQTNLKSWQNMTDVLLSSIIINILFFVLLLVILMKYTVFYKVEHCDPNTEILAKQNPLKITVCLL